MKKSQYLIASIAILFLTIVVSYSFHIHDNLKEKMPIKSATWLLGKGAFFSDTLNQPYSHLVSDFRLLELSGSTKNRVIIKGYENAKAYLKTDIRNDTLFIERAKPSNDTILVAVEDEYPILVTVGAAGLSTITLQKGGKIDIPARPYGAREDGEAVYKPEAWNKYVLKNDKLDLILKDGSGGKFFLDLGTLNLTINNRITPDLQNITYSYYNGASTTTVSRTTAMSQMIGKVKRMNVINPKGMAKINNNEKDLKVDTIIVQSNSLDGSFDSGQIRVKCNDFLKADLRYQLDVVYKGSPEIIKTERDYGRVLNGNQIPRN